jgi:hypothetical protein
MLLAESIKNIRNANLSLSRVFLAPVRMIDSPFDPFPILRLDCSKNMSVV